MMIKIKQDIVDKIVSHGRIEAPLEACGYLAERDGVVCEHFELTNIDKSPVHFSMDPAEQFAAAKECRNQGLKIRAVYHSHPETPARPSIEDIKLAYDPSLSYVIVSLAGSEPSIKSFIIQKGSVESEELEIAKQEKQGKKMETQIKADVFQNLRGVGCPMNLVKTKVAFSKMQSGQILGLVLDDGPPINNVPGSVIREGHEILLQEQLEDGAWSVLIRKA
jgi:proteasome lid subunit RPN8/RPN11/TusA-related sulfurtransferase